MWINKGVFTNQEIKHYLKRVWKGGPGPNCRGSCPGKGTRQQCLKHSSNTQGGFEQGRKSNKCLVKKVLLFNELKKMTADSQELWQ